MKSKFPLICLIFCVVFLMLSLSACSKDKEETLDPEKALIGNWNQYRNRAYILLSFSSQGKWSSSVRVADVTSKIVKSKGSATGTWHLGNGRLILTVMETSIENVWKKNETKLFEIMELRDDAMELKEESGWVGLWKKNRGPKKEKEEKTASIIVPLEPLVVNLNKISSNAPDKYLCLSMKLTLKELMPGQKIPAFHPKARESMVFFLSALIEDDVHNFEKIRGQQERLVEIINPYMEGVVKSVDIDRVIVSSQLEKAEAFLFKYALDAQNQTDSTGNYTEAKASADTN